MAKNHPRPSPPVQQGLSTFLGVFTPSLLTILGVVLFLRTGWMVGNVGLVPALGIVLLAHAITLATALSVSAVATNMTIGAGGAYFMISRSLGLEIGGAVGIPLFLAQTFSLTLYAFGFAEGLRIFWPEIPQVLVAAGTIAVVSALAGRSASLALKLQIPILIAIALAVASLTVGAAQQASSSLPLWHATPGGEGFWVVFAVFFPAVTGLMAGVALSGDLEDPKRSIPRGTLTAVVAGFVVYFTVPIALAAAASPEQLVGSDQVWQEIAFVPLLVPIGLFGAAFSSAVGSMLGAPRTLEALMADGVLPDLRAPAGNSDPGRKSSSRVPHLLSTAVALFAVLLGDLNAVAEILTMFFLTSYGVVNLVAAGEQLAGSPSYRPAIRVPWYVSLLGAMGCLAVMLLISPWAAIAALVIELLVYRGLRRRSIAATWGDLRYGATMSLTRSLLLRLRRLPVDPRNWRPHILVFAGDLERRLELVRWASWLNQGRGILTVSKILVGDFEERGHEIAGELEAMNGILQQEDLVAFPEVEIASDFETGALQIMQANGIAGLSSNTLMMGWRQDPARLATVLRVVRRAAIIGKSSVVCKQAPTTWSRRHRRIDVWWGGLQNNGDMLLLFAYLIAANREWARARIHVKAIATSAMTFDKMTASLAELVQRTRIQAATRVYERPENCTVTQLIQRESRNADLVLLGIQEARAGEERRYAERLAKLVGDLPTVLLVRASGPFAGQLLTPEERPQAHLPSPPHPE